MKYTALIVEDEAPAIAVIRAYLRKYEEVEVTGECRNGFEGLKAIQTQNPDIVFLDIQMPKLTGFELLEALDAAPQVIFSTAYDEFALKAFDMNAVDYLLKPYSEERFDQAMKKALYNLAHGIRGDKIESLKSHLVSQRESISRIVVKNGAHIRIIAAHDVKYLEAQDDYVMIYSEEGKYLKQQTMKYYEERLDQNDFIRVHRSYIVNIICIARVEPFEKSTHMITLKTGEKLPVSRGGYQRLREKLNF